MFKVTEVDQEKHKEPEKSQSLGFISFFGNNRPKFLQIVSPFGIVERKREWKTSQLLKSICILCFTSPLMVVSEWGCEK